MLGNPCTQRWLLLLQEVPPSVAWRRVALQDPDIARVMGGAIMIAATRKRATYTALRRVLPGTAPCKPCEVSEVQIQMHISAQSIIAVLEDTICHALDGQHKSKATSGCMSRVS